jgi:hypothetical protein
MIFSELLANMSFIFDDDPECLPYRKEDEDTYVSLLEDSTGIRLKILGDPPVVGIKMTAAARREETTYHTEQRKERMVDEEFATKHAEGFELVTAYFMSPWFCYIFINRR